jgi:hypothetical protein
MTHDKGFHIKLRNYGRGKRWNQLTVLTPHRGVMSGRTHLEEGVLLLALQLVGAKELKTTGSLVRGKTVLVALEELEHVLDDDGLKVDLLLIVEVLSLELDLCAVSDKGRKPRRK